MKKCTKCKEVKTIDCFYKLKNTKDGLDYWCKDCKNEQISKYNQRPDIIVKKKKYQKEYDQRPEVRARAKKLRRIYDQKPEVRAKNKEYSQRPEVKARQKEQDLKRLYGLSKEEYNLMLLEQDNKCAICRKKLVKPNVDHCHETNKVRGILCSSCNVGLGLLGDSIEGLEKVIKYLNNQK